MKGSRLIEYWIPRLTYAQLDRMRLYAHHPDVREAARDEMSERRWEVARIRAAREHREARA